MKKKIFAIITCVIFSCFIFTGCSKQETAIHKDNTEIETETVSEEADVSEKEETEKSEKTQSKTIPKTKKEEEELFGTSDENGNWIPPEGSYTDPKTGTVYNKEGTVIGNDPRYYNPNRYPNAVG